MNQDYTSFLELFNPVFEKVYTSLPQRYCGIHGHEISNGFFDPVLPLFAEGKRLRPYLIYTTGYNNPENALHAGIAYEIMHTFALVHDDIIDDAQMRRNNPTVHNVFENTMNKNGKSAALLLGDYLLLYANEYLQEHVPELMAVFFEAQTHLCFGQYFELLNWNRSITEKTARTVAQMKSGDYTFKYPMKMGMIISGFPLSALDAYADAAGLMYQLRDDWMDLIESSDEGKDKHIDAKNGVMNLVTMYLHQYGTLEKTKKAVQEELTQLRDLSISSLENTPLNYQQKNSLKQLSEFISVI